MDTLPEVTLFAVIGKNRDSLVQADRLRRRQRTSTSGAGCWRAARSECKTIVTRACVACHGRAPGRGHRRDCAPAGDRGDVTHTAIARYNVPRYAATRVDRIATRTRLVASASIPLRTRMPESA
ncbi:hypothetical protein GQ56_0107380 [Burkholderia paludis]|nr:hypothetical protein GQ56_0107380 [Burkholderia paludis]